MFITFEGPEGSGKSTQIRLLDEQLRARGMPTLLTREPGGTPTGEAIRRLLQHEASDAEMAHRTEVLLFCASRSQIVEQVIRPALGQGTWVLCDRFTDSTLAYQGYGRGFALDELRALNRFATGGLVPDLTLLLDIPVDESFRRIAARASAIDRIERAEQVFHERLRAGYLELAAAEPLRFRVLSSARPAGQTAALVWQAVLDRFEPNELKHHAD
ncbi:MAG: dTMP kinase [bacterium]